MLLAPTHVFAQDDATLQFNVQGMLDAAMRAAKDPPACLKPLVNNELSFVKRVCEPTEEQMAAIVVAAKKAYLALSDMVSEPNQPIILNGNIIFMGPNQERLTGNPYTRIRRDAAQYLKPLLSEQQYERYLDEAKQRDEFEREAAIGIAIIFVDNQLVLTSQQRTQLFDRLMQDWVEVDVLWMQRFLSNPQFTLPVPSNLLEPILNKTQRNIWSVTTRNRAFLQGYLMNQKSSGFDEDWFK